MNDPPPMHDLITASVYAIAGELQRDAVELGAQFISEADLRAATRRALQAQMGRLVRPEWPVPGSEGWPKTRLGAFDIGIGDGASLTGAVELKWCKGKSKLGEALWDALKLLPYVCGSTALTGAYLLYGAPISSWTLTTEPAVLFRNGSHRVADLLSDYRPQWEWLLKGNKTARPRFLPSTFQTHEIAKVPLLAPAGPSWEIRCALIGASDEDVVQFAQNGWPVS